MKKREGSKAEEELESARNAIGSLSSKVESINNLSLPYSNATRDIIIIKKIKPILDRFPRKQARIKKAPL